MRTTRKLWIGVLVLVLLSPLGLLIPAWFNAGGAWGEWSSEELRKVLGYVPAGMERLSRLWHAPLSGYAVPGNGAGVARQGLEYILTAVIGAAAAAALVYLAARLLGRKDD